MQGALVVLHRQGDAHFALLVQQPSLGIGHAGGRLADAGHGIEAQQRLREGAGGAELGFRDIHVVRAAVAAGAEQPRIPAQHLARAARRRARIGVAGQLAVAAAVDIDRIQARSVLHVALGDIAIHHAIDDAPLVDPGDAADIGVFEQVRPATFMLGKSTV